MACKVFRNNNKIIKVLAPNDKESILFNDIVALPEINGDKELALRKWATIYMDDFKDEFGDWESTPEAFEGKLDNNGEPLVQYIKGEQHKLLNDLKVGDKNILEAREKESKKNIFIESISEVEHDLDDNNFRVEDYTEVETRLDGVYKKLQDNLDYQLSILKKYDKDGSKPVVDRVSNIVDTLKKYSDTNKIKGVLHYIKSIDREINSVQNALNLRNKEGKDMAVILENYKKYLSLFSSIDDINDIYKDAVQFGDIKEYKNISNKIKDIKATHDNIEKQFTSITRQYMSDNLNDVKYHPKVEAKWKERLERQYNEIHQDIPSRLNDKGSKKNWINKKLLEYKPSIDKDVAKATKELIYNKAFDITYFAEQFLSALEINSDIVQVFQTELSEIRDKIIEELTPIDRAISDSFDEFKSEKGDYNPQKQFDKILEKDSKGNYYLKGEYKIEFMENHRKLQEMYDERKTIDAETQKDEYSEISKNINALRKDLYVIKNGKVKSIKVKWKNKFNNLTSVDKSTLEMFKDITQASRDNTHGINSLVKSVGYVPATFFYKLPSITKSDMERVLGGGSQAAKGLIKDKITDITTVRPDDIGYEKVKATASGEVIREIPIHFRGQIDSSNQSLDLFSMYKMEAQNSISFKHRKNKEMFLEMIVDIATNKDYYQTKGLSFTPLLNRFAKRNKDLALKGNENTKVVKKLKGLMDAQIYDITKKYQGKFGKYDVQKMVGFINGYTGMLGMSLNYHSALVNLTGGYAQFLIHAMSKDVININNIKKALAKYHNNTTHNIKDINRANDTSFTNQLNIMFDTFGGHNIGTNSFLKDKTWKKFANLHGLTGLHQLGEHQLQSVLTMAVLDSVTALDGDGNPISKKGVESSLLDSLSLNDKGRLEMDSNVVFTSHTPITKWKKGGKVQIQQLLKYKMFQTLGNYDDNLQPEIMKTAQGRLLLMFRRFFIPLAINRFRGISTFTKKNEDIKDHERFFSHANKRYEEGSYTTTLRFLTNNVIPGLKSLKLKMVMQDYSKLTDYERSNIHKTAIEFSMALIMGILGSLVAEAAKDDDDELLYFLAYTMRRTESELRQFQSLKESYRITKSPFASLRTLENVTDLLTNLVTPLTWGDKYKSGKRKGELKLTRELEKMIPVISKTDRSNKELYNYLESSFMSF